jgi:hypothetical protein
MKSRFILFRRAGVFYYEDTETKRQLSLKTKDEAEAQTLLAAKNESFRQPILNLHIARTYLIATDPEIAKRTWQCPIAEMGKTKTGSTRIRHDRAMKNKAFDAIRNLPILETGSAQLLKVLKNGGRGHQCFPASCSQLCTERRAFYECCWHLGGAQTDIANLSADDIDWKSQVVSFHRKKTGTVSIIRFGNELAGPA